MSTSPTRSSPPFAETATATVPFPFPDWPDVIVIHPALLVAVQLQPVNALTVTDNPPPPDPIESRVRLMLYRQAAAACET